MLAPIEHKVCQYLQDWGEGSQAPASVHEWAVRIGWTRHFRDDPKQGQVRDHEAAVERAVAEAKGLVAFVQRLINEELGGDVQIVHSDLPPMHKRPR